MSPFQKKKVISVIGSMSLSEMNERRTEGFKSHVFPTNFHLSTSKYILLFMFVSFSIFDGAEPCLSDIWLTKLHQAVPLVVVNFIFTHLEAPLSFETFAKAQNGWRKDLSFLKLQFSLRSFSYAIDQYLSPF